VREFERRITRWPRCLNALLGDTTACEPSSPRLHLPCTTLAWEVPEQVQLQRSVPVDTVRAAVPWRRMNLIGLGVAASHYLVGVTGVVRLVPGKSKAL
jgi:hypothetical protein